jgi:histidinol-phosphate phosphatase family protein
MQHTSLHINQLPIIDQSWTLFLDRDGVINEDVVGDYIKEWESFVFRAGTLEAISILSPLFARVIIVSNQRGVEKGLMTRAELDRITNNMLLAIEEAGGKIDQVFYCTSLNNQDPNRKPNSGMAIQAKDMFPEIDFSKSIMVGNMPSDMWFGKNIGAYTVYLPTRPDENPEAHTIDAVYKDLLAFAKDLLQKQESI